MSCLVIKIIACVCMVIDHIGVIMYHGIPRDSFYQCLRFIGRIAFPLYCFLLAEGVKHTSNKLRYLIRLMFFSFISQFAYNYFEFYDLASFSDLNIFFTLSFSFACLCILDYFKNRDMPMKIPVYFSICFYTFVIGCALPLMYSGYGTVLPLLFYFYDYKDKKTLLIPFIGLIVLNYVFVKRPFSVNQWNSLTCLIPAYLYNGNRGPGNKYIFYIFFPIHLIALRLIFEAIK